MAITQKDAMRQLLGNRQLLMETLLEVEDKNRELVPLKLYRIQADINETRTGRDIYVKPAQIGASTYFINDYLIDCLTIRGTTAVIISYDEFITGRLLRKAHNSHKILSSRIPSIPQMQHKSTYEMTFADMNSSFYIASARSFTIGRGETIHKLLIDEFAFWQATDAEKVFASAIQRVPLLPTTNIDILSTPNGEDNAFCETYYAALEGKAIGASTFTPHFYPWYMHEEYYLLADNPFVLPGDNSPILQNLDSEEVGLVRIFMEQYGMDEVEANDRIRWRRYKQAEMASVSRSSGNALLFRQEYPEDDRSCFLATGDMFYDSVVIESKIRTCEPPVFRELRADVWELPKENVKYLMSIDPGKGKTSESVAHIWRFEEATEESPQRFIHCATLCGYYDEAEMAEYCMVLGKHYNNAVAAPECNLDIVSHMKTYPEFYYMTDPVTGKVTTTRGWMTTGNTKPYMLTELNRHIDQIDCKDRRFWSQLRNIRRYGDKVISIGADDHHDCGCIAIVCRSVMPITRGFAGCAGWDDTW